MAKKSNQKRNPGFGAIPDNYVDDGRHPSQETAIRYPEDMRLRDFGYSLFARPEGKDSVWIKDRDFYTKSQALWEIKKLIEACERHEP